MENVSQEFNEQKKAVSLLRNELNSTDEKIEKLFGQKRVVGSTIAEKLRRVKALRIERDELTKKVKAQKEERMGVQQQLKEKIDASKELLKTKEDLKSKYDVRGDISGIQKEIERIEYKIQTEVMPFSKEQELVKRMKDLQKKADSVQVVREAFDKIRAAEKEVHELKKKNEEAHHHVQDNASQSQKKHEEMQALLNEVDVLREQEKKFEADIAPLKKQLEDVRAKLEVELLKLNELGKSLGVQREELQKQREENQRHHKERIDHELEEKTRSVEEKLKKGQKLTTADLIAWQAKNE